MIDSCRGISDFVKETNYHDFMNDRKLSLSIVRLIEIVGEAANSISPSFRSEFDQVPWRDIIDMRNRLIHGYFDIDLDLVWITVTDEMPELLEELEKIGDSDLV